MAKNKDKKDDPSGIFVPAGLLLGLGIGFIYNEVAAGLLIGLGAGFLIMALFKITKKK